MFGVFAYAVRRNVVRRGESDFVVSDHLKAELKGAAEYHTAPESAYGPSPHSPQRTNSGRSLGNSRQRSDRRLKSYAANDPKRTLAVHCGNGFDAGFSPYQCARLSR
jgi:hypothetical protein